MVSELDRQLMEVKEKYPEVDKYIKNHLIRDSVTGLYSRRYFDETLPREVSEAGRNDKLISLIFMDLDNFKPVNDNIGHGEGDAVLETTGRIINSSIRKTDLAFRYGGDEFAILTSSSGALEIAKKISHVYKNRLLSDDNIRSFLLSDDNTRSYNSSLLSNIDLSIGIANARGYIGQRGSRDSSLDSYMEEFIKAADSAMYNAKENKSKKICIHPLIIG